MLRASDMVLVDYDGNAIGGNMSRPANAAGFLIHSALHKARPDVNAACHTHSPAGKAWSAFARPLEMLNQDVTYFYRDAQAVYEVWTVPSACTVMFELIRGAGLWRRGVHARGGRAAGRGAGATGQGHDSAESWLAHCRRHGRRGCVLVHADGAEL